MSRSPRMLLLIVLFLPGLCRPAAAQELPKVTPEARKALQELITACVTGGGLKETPAPKDQGPWWAIADASKLEDITRAHKDLCTAELRDALIVGFDSATETQRPVYAALMHALGKVTEDKRTLAFAALFTGWTRHHQLQLADAVTAYEEAGQRFAALEDQAWQATSLNNLGRVLQDQGKFLQAQHSFEQALATNRKLYPEERFPQGQRDLVQNLNNLGSVLEAQAEYARAQSYFEQALAMCRKLYPEGHPDLATSLNNLGAVLRAQGQFARAQPYYEEALAMRQKLYPAERYPQGHPDLASSLNSLGILHHSRGEYARAQGYYEQALAMRRNLYPETDYPQGHPLLAGSLSNLGSVLQAQGEYDRAQDYFEQALVMNQKLYPEKRFPQGHPLLALSLNNLGGLLENQGEYARAQRYYEQALAMRRRLYPEERYPQGHPELATSLTNLGALLKAEGEYALARSYFEQARAMNHKLYPQGRFPEGHPALSLILNHLGLLLEKQGDYAGAQGYLEQALAMRRKLYPEARFPQGHPQLATTLNNLGLLLATHGDYARARSYFEQALAMRRKLYPEGRYPHGHPELAQSLSNLGGLLVNQGEYARAQRYLDQALAMRQQLYPEDRYPQGHPQLASSLNSLGALLEMQEDYARAEGYYRRALLASRVLARDLPLQQPQTAAALLEPTPQTMSMAANYAWTLEQQVATESSGTALRACADAYDLVAALHERMRREVLQRAESQLQHGALAANLLPRRLALYRRLFERDHEVRDLHAAFAAYEQSRARVFLDSLGEANATRLAGLPAELRCEEDCLRSALRLCNVRLAAALQEGSATAQARLPKLWYDQQDAEADLLRFTQKLAEQYPQYAALRYPQPCTVAEARACLDKNEVALLFALGTDTSYVLLFQAHPANDDRADGLAIHELPGRAVLRRQVEALLQRERLELPGGTSALGDAVYRLLLGPLAKQLDGKDLVIVADGVLCHLPFELLVEGADESHDGRFLLEGHRIRYAPSMTALHMVRLWEAKRPQRPPEPLWALGDPVYSVRDERLQGPEKPQLAARSQEVLAEYVSRERGAAETPEGFVRLRFSGREVRAIRDLLGARDDAVLTDLLATEAAVKVASQKGLLAQARYVHFAVHGILGFDSGRPPALVLSLVGNDGTQDEHGTNDGFLELTEVTDLKLNADLVVLSACRSGEGRLHNGEGISGLARAFQYAGCRGVVCSLWSVDDAATAELMQGLYRRLQAGQSAAQALREAKLAMIHDRRAPVYWAPFILMGQ